MDGKAIGLLSLGLLFLAGSAAAQAGALPLEVSVEVLGRSVVPYVPATVVVSVRNRLAEPVAIVGLRGASGEEVFLGVVEIDALERNGHDLRAGCFDGGGHLSVGGKLACAQDQARGENTITDLQCIIHESMPLRLALLQQRRA
jgi:hypothetical protein